MEHQMLSERDASRAFELAKNYYRTFYNESTGALRFNFPNTRGLSTCWEYIGLMSMTDRLAELDRSFRPLLENVIRNLDYYGYQKDGKLWGYVVHRGKTPMGAADPGLAFDDNIWLTINFLRAYELTGSKAYLEKAEHLAQLLLREAWFEPLGGMYWDSRKDARHSCSNHPLIAPLVKLAKITGKDGYLDWAKKIYQFSLKLEHPEKHVFYDLVRAMKKPDGSWEEGVPEGKFYTYNTGSFLSGAAALYGATGDQAYLDAALRCAEGAFREFGRRDDVPGYVGLPVDTTVWFNSILLKGFLDVYAVAPKTLRPIIEAVQRDLDYAYDHYLKDGFLPVDWLRGPAAGGDKEIHREALDQSAQIEIYALLSQFEAGLENSLGEKVE